MSRSTKLVREPNFFDAGVPESACAGDTFYEMLIAAHEGLDDESARAFDCRLILMLANHIGDLAVLREALEAVKGDG